MNIESRVALRHIVTKNLTKQWLMGVRRGWLTLMKPNILDWGDVFRAIKRLQIFVENLKEQIEYVRRGILRLRKDDFQPKLDKGFKHLLDAIQETLNSAHHWQEVAESDTPYYHGTFKRENGQYMFDRFQNHFEETTSTSVRKKGGGGLVREAPLTELLDRILKLLREDAAATEKYNKANPEAPWSPEEILKEFSVNDMKFIVVMPEGKAVATAQDFAKYLIKAYALLRRKKMTKLWYGRCFLSPECEKLSDQEIRIYESLGYKREYIKCRGGWFSYQNDVMAFTSPLSPRLVYTMMHELGHRYWFKFMTSEQRARFSNLVKVRGRGRDKLVEIPSILDRTMTLYTVRQVEQAKNRVRREAKDGEEMLIFLQKKMVTPTLSADLVKKRLAYWFASDLLIEPILHIIEKQFPVINEAQEKSLSYLKEAQDAGRAVKDLASTAATKDPKDLKRLLGKLEQLYQGLVVATLIYLDVARDAHNEAVRDKLMSDPELRAQFLSDREKVPAVTNYGESNPEEAFAEAFAHYITETDMTRDQMESFRSVLGSMSFRIIRQFLAKGPVVTLA
jgi:hypothetical protein